MGRKKINKIIEASYLNQNEASKMLENMGYKYDPELWTNESKVFLDWQGRPNIAFRGSKRVFDDFLGSDLKFAFGLQKYDRRFQEAKHLTKLVEDKYQQPANVFGHSIAGRLGEESGAHGKIITVNKGAGLFDIGKSIPQNQTDTSINRQFVASNQMFLYINLHNFGIFAFQEFNGLSWHHLSPNKNALSLSKY